MTTFEATNLPSQRLSSQRPGHQKLDVDVARPTEAQRLDNPGRLDGGHGVREGVDAGDAKAQEAYLFGFFGPRKPRKKDVKSSHHLVASGVFMFFGWFFFGGMRACWGRGVLEAAADGLSQVDKRWFWWAEWSH